MLFKIIDKTTNKIKSNNLNAFMVHYLFIDKKWDKLNCNISSSIGDKMDYKTFNKIYPL